ncbi:hypothetical protein GMI69_03645 [Eggerthellaceae bacterium zg-887]|nr:hypothetical protein [Xiamenia xianingshaonis]
MTGSIKVVAGEGKKIAWTDGEDPAETDNPAGTGPWTMNISPSLYTVTVAKDEGAPVAVDGEFKLKDAGTYTVTVTSKAPTPEGDAPDPAETAELTIEVNPATAQVVVPKTAALGVASTQSIADSVQVLDLDGEPLDTVDRVVKLYDESDREVTPLNDTIITTPVKYKAVVDSITDGNYTPPTSPANGGVVDVVASSDNTAKFASTKTGDTVGVVTVVDALQASSDGSVGTIAWSDTTKTTPTDLATQFKNDVKAGVEVYPEGSKTPLDTGAYEISFTDEDGSALVNADGSTTPQLPGEYGVVVTMNGTDEPLGTGLTLRVVADLGANVDYKLGSYDSTAPKPVLNLVWNKDLTDDAAREADVLEQLQEMKATLKNTAKTPVSNDDLEFKVIELATDSAGTGKVTVSPASNSGFYTGSYTINYAYGKTLPEFSLAEDEDVYNGDTGYALASIVNAPKVKNEDGNLVSFTDYTLSATYVDDEGKTVPAGATLTEVRDYKVTVTGTGDYAGSQTFDFSITPRPVAQKDVDWFGNEDGVLAYDKDDDAWQAAFTGSAIAPKPLIKLDLNAGETNVTLKNKADLSPEQIKNGVAWDYEVAYDNNKNVGTATATVTFHGNYSGTAELPFEIVPASLKTLKATATAQNQLEKDFPEKPTVDDVKGVAITYKVGTGSSAKTVTLGEGDYVVKSLKEKGSSDKKGETTYEFVAEGQGNYAGEVTGTFKTVADSMDIAALWDAEIAEGDYFYRMGEPVEAGVAVKTKPTSTKPATEVKPSVGDKQNFKVVYSDNTEAGTATATIVGCGDYAGSIPLTFEVAPLQISQESVADVKLKQASFDYVPGIEAKPEVDWNASWITPVNEGYTEDRIYLNQLVNDIEITYADNDKAGTAQAIVTGKEGGNVSGSYAVDFAIKPADLAKAEVAGPEAPVAPGTSLADAISVTYQGQAVDAADYEAASEDAVPGAANVTVTGKGNFTGTNAADVVVLYDVAGLDYQVSSGTYNGQSQTPVVTASYKDAEGKTVEVPASALNVAAGSYVNAGKYDIKVTGNNAAGWGGETTVSYTIAPATVTAKPQVSYDAAGLPVVTVPGLTSSDFTYKPDAATKTITVTYKGNYKGTATVAYAPAAKPVAPEQPAAGKTGWVGSGNDWAYYENGVQVKGGWKWIDSDKAWYHFEANGKMTNTQWFQDADGKWYLLNQDHKGKYGSMLAGWQKVGKDWYYMGKSGDMQSGWAKVNGEWYLLNTKHDGTFGKMLTGWQQVGGKWYYMDASGAMASNEWVGRYWVNGSGVWTATR